MESYTTRAIALGLTAVAIAILGLSLRVLTVEHVEMSVATPGRAETMPFGASYGDSAGEDSLHLCQPELRGGAMGDRQRLGVGEMDSLNPVAWVELSSSRASTLTGTLWSLSPSEDDILIYACDLESDRVHRTTPGNDGTFDLCLMKPGRYRFFARHGGKSQTAHCHTEEIELLAGEKHSLRATLLRSSIATGIAANSSGTPLAALEICAKATDGSGLVRYATTDESGRFTIEGLYPGEYELTAGALVALAPLAIKVPGNGARVDTGLWLELIETQEEFALRLSRLQSSMSSVECASSAMASVSKEVAAP